MWGRAMSGFVRRRLELFRVTLVAVAITAIFSSATIQAQTGAAIQSSKGAGSRPVPDKPNGGPIGDSINSNTIAIISGNLNATYLTIAYDLSAVLDDGNNFRVLPVVGKGGGQNIT